MGIPGLFAGCVFSDVKLIGYLDDARQIKREDRILGLRAMLKPLFMVLLSELTVYLICKIKGFNYLGFPLSGRNPWYSACDNCEQGKDKS